MHDTHVEILRQVWKANLCQQQLLFEKNGLEKSTHTGLDDEVTLESEGFEKQMFDTVPPFPDLYHQYTVASWL